MLQSGSLLSFQLKVDRITPVTQEGHCKQALITREYVLVLNAEEEAVVGFIEELQRRLAPRQPTARMATLAGSMSMPDLHHVRGSTCNVCSLRLELPVAWRRGSRQRHHLQSKCMPHASCCCVQEHQSISSAWTSTFDII